MASSALSAFSAGIDLYCILNVSKNASHGDIVRAYRDLAREHHPDKQGDSESMKLLNLAYEVLRDQDQRAEYDDYVANDEEDVLPAAAAWASHIMTRLSRVTRAVFLSPARRSFDMSDSKPGPPQPRVDRLSNTVWINLEHIQHGVAVRIGATAAVAVQPGTLNGARVRTESGLYTIKTRPHSVYRRGGTAIDPCTRPCDLVMDVDHTGDPNNGVHGVATALSGRRWMWRVNEEETTTRIRGAGLPIVDAANTVSRFGDIVVMLVCAKQRHTRRLAAA